MASSSVMQGARAKVSVNGVLVGVFNQVNWGKSLDNTPIFVLGRDSATEIALTGQDPISISCTGWRSVADPNNPGSVYTGPYAPGQTDNSPGSSLGMPKLQDMLTAPDLVLTILDRKTDQVIMTAINAKCISYSTGLSARGVMELSVTYMATTEWDESGPQSESQGAVTENFN